MLLYVAVGLIPLAVLSVYALPRLEKDYREELGREQRRDVLGWEENKRRAQDNLQEFMRVELAREFTEFQHWRSISRQRDEQWYY